MPPAVGFEPAPVCWSYNNNSINTIEDRYNLLGNWYNRNDNDNYNNNNHNIIMYINMTRKKCPETLRRTLPPETHCIIRYSDTNTRSAKRHRRFPVSATCREIRIV